ncbi:MULTISPECIES: hypothetical protein [Thermoanaerobacter]|uniref:Preprotein translocase subunit SecF n=1 Tax=Thermoanaerobacter pentosaceus TaxID=694059 RepID=A0ABT9M333_9THEO|nr:MULTISPECIES: hypothetical protein [Thermoanaerobacter]MDP9750539.1 preprotein translocase subunit SecF [Thermoanaerobacter pentosaceus]
MLKRLKFYLVVVIVIALFTTMFMFKTNFEEPIYFSQQSLWEKNKEQLTKEENNSCKEEQPIDSKKDKEKKEMARLENQQKEEAYDLENNKKTQKENSNDDRVIVTLEKILQVRNEMDPSQKARVINILLKLGKDDMSEIMKMAQKGLTQEDSDKIMEILKNKLSSEEISYLVEIANEYFAKK